MALVERTIAGDYLDASGNALANTEFYIKPVAVFGEGGEIVPTATITVITDEDGAYTTDLLTSDVPGAYVRYQAILRGGVRKKFDLPDGATTSLDELINAYDGAQSASAAVTILDHEERITDLEDNPSGGGSVATDVIFDAKGDLPVGTGADTAAKLAVGANDTFLVPDSAQATGLKWITAAAVKTLLALVKGDVGLGNVDNTPDANKPVSTATQTALDAKLGGSTGSNDNRLLRSDGTVGKTAQASGITIDDSDKVLIPASFSLAAPNLALNATTLGFTQSSDNAIYIVGSGRSIAINHGSFVVTNPGNYQYTWAAGDPSAGGPDTGLARQAAGVVKITDGSTGLGKLMIGSQTPASASAAGEAGTIVWDSSFIYICTATNTWKRCAISTW